MRASTYVQPVAFTPEEQDKVDAAEAARIRTAQESFGYRDIDSIKGIVVGDRVHHRGERYWEARENGTAVVLAIFEKAPSEWSRTYGSRDIELIVQRDKPLCDRLSRVSVWADYHTAAVQR